MADDISRKTLFVLVILTLLISVLGTWTVLSQINAGPSIQPPPKGDSGEVHFTIGSNAPPPSSSVTGDVAFVIQQQG